MQLYHLIYIAPLISHTYLLSNAAANIIKTRKEIQTKDWHYFKPSQRSPRMNDKERTAASYIIGTDEQRFQKEAYMLACRCTWKSRKSKHQNFYGFRLCVHPFCSMLFCYHDVNFIEECCEAELFACSHQAITTKLLLGRQNSSMWSSRSWS